MLQHWDGYYSRLGYEHDAGRERAEWEGRAEAPIELGWIAGWFGGVAAALLGLGALIVWLS